LTDFKALIDTLVNAHVDFILVGGVAATVHGAARLTLDVDVVYSRRTENIARLSAALADHKPYLRGAPPGLPFQWDASTIERGLNFSLSTSLGDLDLFGEIVGGGTYEALLPRTVVLNVFGNSCRCLTLEALIAVKRAAGRPKDLEAIAELESIRDLQRAPLTNSPPDETGH
jgi:hypothetical protein